MQTFEGLKIFDTEYEIFDFLKYRINYYKLLYDQKINKYFLQEKTIHYYMLKRAFNAGYYYAFPELKFSDYARQVDKLDLLHIRAHKDLYNLIFVPTQQYDIYHNDIVYDRYSSYYITPIGYFYERGCNFKNTSLYKLIKDKYGEIPQVEIEENMHFIQEIKKCK